MAGERGAAKKPVTPSKAEGRRKALRGIRGYLADSA